MSQDGNEPGNFQRHQVMIFIFEPDPIPPLWVRILNGIVYPICILVAILGVIFGSYGLLAAGTIAFVLGLLNRCRFIAFFLLVGVSLFVLPSPFWLFGLVPVLIAAYHFGKHHL